MQMNHPKPVIKIDKHGKIVAEYRTIGEAAKANYIGQSGMSERIKHGKEYDGFRYGYAK
jgi:hypothetical protein